MRINLLYNSNKVILGYRNVDPFSFDDPNRIPATFDNLDFCSPNEAEEILCNDILSYYSPEEVHTILSHLVSKLHHSGQITISDWNAYEIAREFTLGMITLADFNNLMFGQFPRKCLFGLDEICSFLQDQKLQIIGKSFNKYKFTVRAIRP